MTETEKETVSTLDTNQVASTGPTATPVPSGSEGTTDPTVATFLYPPQGPEPSGTTPASEQKTAQEAEAKGEEAPGVESEQVIWEARYSMKNFIGRIAVRVILTVAWLVLAFYTWGQGHANWQIGTILTGLIVGALWLALLYRIIMARYGHYYRLTNRRLFVSTGVMRRRRDQMELLRVEDVFTRQTLVERWLSVGTVVVVSHESQIPTFYLAGVDDPKQVMDLVWNYARAERTGKAVQVDQV